MFANYAAPNKPKSFQAKFGKEKSQSEKPDIFSLCYCALIFLLEPKYLPTQK